MEIIPVGTDQSIAQTEDIKDTLAKCNLELVGDLAVINTNDGITFYGRRILYIEPQIPPQIPVLSDRQVDALNAAGYYKRFPTHELASIPLQFATEYNTLLEGLKHETGIPFNFAPFRFLVSRLDSHMNYLGSMSVPTILGQSEIIVTTTSNLQVADESTVEQAMRLAEPAVEKHIQNIEGFITIQLYPPSLGRVVYAYDKGFYVDGNVLEWSEITYRNRYVRPESLTFEQLQDLAKGGHPYPEVPQLDKSIFETMTERDARMELRRRGISMGSMHWTINDFYRPYQGGDFDENSYDYTIKRDGDSAEKHNHSGKVTSWDS